MADKQGPFVPEPGQVDYTDIRYCPVVNTVVVCDGKVLLQQRSKGMRLYAGKWSGVSGFLDTNDSVEDKVYEELKEEAGIERDAVKRIIRGQVLVQEAPELGKTWIVFPVLAEVTSTDVTANWEAEDHVWVAPADIYTYDLMPGFEQVVHATVETLL